MNTTRVISPDHNIKDASNDTESLIENKRISLGMGIHSALALSTKMPEGGGGFKLKNLGKISGHGQISAGFRAAIPARVTLTHLPSQHNGSPQP